MVEVVVAIIAATGSVLAAHQSRKANKQTSTSNGKTSGQYIEELAHKADLLNLGQANLQKQLAEHTVQDSVNFAAIEAHLANITRDVSDVQSRVDTIEEQQT